MTETVAAIVAAHRAGALVPAQTVARSFKRIRAYDDPARFISLRDEKDAIAEAEGLPARKDAAHLPLFRVPVAVKDNIDALGLPTTAHTSLAEAALTDVIAPLPGSVWARQVLPLK